MAKAYSVDLRERVLAAHDEGEKVPDLIRRYRVSRRWIYALLERRRKTGSIEPLYGKPGPKPVLGGHLPKLRELVKKQPDATLQELRQALGISVGISTLWRGLRDLGLTLKKSHPRRRAATA